MIKIALMLTFISLVK